MVKLAIDVMGGDHAPHAILAGLTLFHKKHSHVSFLLYGDENVIQPYIKKNASLEAQCAIVHTDECISSETKPSHALRTLLRSSMRLALQAVAQHEADGAISAGNTGAYLALSKSILKTIGGIDRPAIASHIPLQNGQGVVLDLGGTIDVSSRNLVEYAFMGEVFARCILNIEKPVVGLLNVGKERMKGDDTLQQAFALLSKAPLNFYGFIEGNDITKGDVSVIVTDGFTGNIALKTAEGIVELFLNTIRQKLSLGFRERMAAWLLKKHLYAFKTNFDPRSYNGALWLGLNGIAVKSHGGADAVAFFHALETTYSMVKSGLIKKMDRVMSASS